MSPDSAQPIDHNHALDRLIRRARRVVAGAGNRAKREHALVKMVTSHHGAASHEIGRTDVTDMEVPPAEVVRAMRAPVGKQQLVVTYIYGREVKAVINPLGMRRPDRELAVWEKLVELHAELTPELAA